MIFDNLALNKHGKKPNLMENSLEANNTTPSPPLLALLTRLAEALERLAPPHLACARLEDANAFVFHKNPDRLEALDTIKALDLGLLRGIDGVKKQLYDNTLRFAKGHSANNVLLWGARGMGKSSLIKATHAHVNATLTREAPDQACLKIIEIMRDDIVALPSLLRMVRHAPCRIILFCDDLSFDYDDGRYKALKAVLEGGLAGRPEHVLFYATSNRRHLLPRDMRENEIASAIHPGEAVEEKTALADRFGLWLGFYPASQEDYLAIVEAYAKAFGLDTPRENLIAGALEWAVTRANRSGRTAFQYISDVAGREGKTI